MFYFKPFAVFISTVSSLFTSLIYSFSFAVYLSAACILLLLTLRVAFHLCVYVLCPCWMCLFCAYLSFILASSIVCNEYECGWLAPLHHPSFQSVAPNRLTNCIENIYNWLWCNGTMSYQYFCDRLTMLERCSCCPRCVFFRQWNCFRLGENSECILLHVRYCLA